MKAFFKEVILKPSREAERKAKAVVSSITSFDHIKQYSGPICECGAHMSVDTEKIQSDEFSYSRFNPVSEIKILCCNQCGRTEEIETL